MASNTTETVTRAQIKALRSEAREAGDWVQVALCEVAMERHASAHDVADAHPDVRSRLEALGVIIDNVTCEAVAERLCAKAIRNASAQV